MPYFLALDKRFTNVFVFGICMENLYLGNVISLHVGSNMKINLFRYDRNIYFKFAHMEPGMPFYITVGTYVVPIVRSSLFYYFSILEVFFMFHTLTAKVMSSRKRVESQPFREQKFSEKSTRSGIKPAA